MNHRALAGLPAMACLLFSSQAQAQQAPPAEAFASLPDMTHVRMTPDGQKLAWAADPGGKPIVVIYDLAAMKTLRRVDAGDYAVRDLDWADNRTLLITASTTDSTNRSTTAEKQYEVYRVVALDADGGDMRMLLMDSESRRRVTGAHIVRLHTGKPETILMSSWDYSETAYTQPTGSRLRGGRKDEGWLYSLFEVSTRTGAGKKLEPGTPFTDQWLTDAQGRPLARSEWHPENHEYSIYVKGAGGWKQILKLDDGSSLVLETVSADGRSIIARGSRGGDRDKVWSIPVDGSDITLVHEHPDYDVRNTIEDRYSGAPVGFLIGGPRPTIDWTDPKLADMQKSISRAFPGMVTEIFDPSENYQRILTRVEHASNPPVYYLIDTAKRTADTIGEAYPKLTNVPLGKQDVTSYAARDGIDIPAYLTTPPGRDPTKLPLVVLPHGGPQSRDDTGFDWLAQFLATRGYAVLQPQFRGSEGFSEELRRAGTRQWGQGMQDDVTDGVRKLIADGLVDPARVCIVGASYGGYAALAGAAFTPELYRCAVSINGVADIPSFLGFVKRQHGEQSDSLQFWIDTVGNPSDDDLAKFSPARSIATIKAPILLVHATNDTLVPYAQSENFARRLKEQGKNYQLLELTGEDHWLSTSDSRLKVLKSLEGFLAAHLSQ